MLTKSLPYYVIAGNFQEFQDFVIRKRVQGLFFDYRHVGHPDQLRGLTEIRGCYTGTYQDRKDLQKIQEMIAIIKSR